MFKNSFYGHIMPFYSAMVGILLACTAAPGFAQAQIPGLPGETAAPSAEIKADETRIAIAEIPVRADDDELAIQEITRQVALDVKLQRFASDLQGISDRVDSLDANYQPKDLAQLPIRRLESLKRHWQLIDVELKVWHSGLQSVIHPLSEHGGILAEQRRLWSATRDDATLPRPLVWRIDELLLQIDAANAAVSLPLGRLLELDRKASPVRRQINRQLIEVSALIGRIDRDLTRIDSPNLLEALGGRDKSQGIGAELLKKGLDIETEFSKDFNKRNAVFCSCMASLQQQTRFRR